MPDTASCPRCGAASPVERSEVGALATCPSCGLEWAEDLALDFRTD